MIPLINFSHKNLHNRSDLTRSRVSTNKSFYKVIFNKCCRNQIWFRFRLDFQLHSECDCEREWSEVSGVVKQRETNLPPTFLVVGWYSNSNWNSNENSTMQRIRHIEVIETNENADHEVLCDAASQPAIQPTTNTKLLQIVDWLSLFSFSKLIFNIFCVSFLILVSFFGKIDDDGRQLGHKRVSMWL